LPPDFSREVYCLLGLPFDAVDLEAAEQYVRTAAVNRSRCFLSTPNLNFLIAAQTDATFRESVVNSDLSVADGMPIVWIAKLLDVPIKQRVAGSDLFKRLMKGAAPKLSIFFFGGTDGVSEAACRQLNSSASGLTCVGFESPGFGSIQDMSSDATIERINASNADFLVVALGAKKGQAWIEHNRTRLSVPIISHLGAVVNFVAGTVNRAPSIVQSVGLEWLWRIKEEPSLWRRYFKDGLGYIRLFFICVLPHVWQLLLFRATTNQCAKAEFVIQEQAQVTTVFLRGSWLHTDLAPLREAFPRLVRTEKNLVLDMANVTHVDSAFIGLVMLLHGHQKEQGRSLKLVSLRNEVRRLFKYSCVEYLCVAGS
jgi:N-acetylglucosaminyldiphosphoundecaprenol N-acetyl-beta-D-mannosaminyltransferase